MNGGKRGEAGGKSQEKVQVTLFFFLETNSGWTRGDARQFTKSQALLSHFSKPHNLDTGPQLLQLLPHKPHSLTFANLVRKKGKGRKKKFSTRPLLTHTAKMSVKTVHVKLRKMVLPPEQPDLCLFSPAMAVNAEKRKTKWQDPLNNLRDSFKVVFPDKVILDILLCFLPWKGRLSNSTPPPPPLPPPPPPPPPSEIIRRLSSCEPLCF